MLKDNTAIGTENYSSQIRELPLANFHPESPVWIYLASRPLSEMEANDINRATSQFVRQWVSHGNTVSGYGGLLFNRFLVLSANAAIVSPSGCSMDSSVKFVQEVDNRYSLDLFDRLKIGFIDREGEIDTLQLSALKSAMEEDTIDEDSPIFDNTINKLGPFREQWIKPLGESWVKNFI